MRTILLTALFLCPLAAAPASESCPPLQDSDRAKLVQYVQRKYKVSPALPLSVTQSGVLADSCFRQLSFTSQDRARPFQLNLIASPNLRFLTKEILDTRIDPIEEERQKQKALTAELARPGGAALGSKGAPVIINLFSDFQCPFCSQMAQGLMKDILPVEGDRVRLVFRNFPLAMHPWARPAAEAAECARTQSDKYFWSLHDYLFEHQREITPANLKEKLSGYVSGLEGFDASGFTACVDQHKSAARVEEDLAMGRRLGVTGTPTMFVNGERITGYRPEPLKSLIRQISEAESKPVLPTGGNLEGQSCTADKCERK